MLKIDKLEVKNFKFFDDVKPLEFDAKNILIYGENGSGKSTIYWALYTLLQSSIKDDEKIKKYFTKEDNDSLVNAYTEDDTDSKVRLYVKDDDTEYTISKDHITIKGDDKLIEKTLYTSDFINYKYLFRFFNFLHRDEIDLFSIFEYEILQYLNKDGQNLYDLWKDILNLEKDKPNQHYTQKSRYDMLQRNISLFHSYLNSFLEDIALKTKEYLKQFGYQDINIAFQAKKAKYERITDRPPYHFTKPKIILFIKIDDKHIPKPQSYFNEAKLTAIALSVRFSITKIKLKEGPLKLLVLDDLLVSLDMSNRDKVLEIILNDDDLKNYQKIILTHDKAFFEMAKRKFDYMQQGKWKYFEMYIDIKSDKEKPFIMPHRNYFEKAEYYFIRHDYPACANYLRKEAERLLKSLVCHTIDLSCEETKNLQQLIDKSKAKGSLRQKETIVENIRKLTSFDSFEKFLNFDISQIATIEDKKVIGEIKSELKKFKNYSIQEIEGLKDTLDRLEEFKTLILNPHSHDDSKIPIYKKELEDAIVTIKKFIEQIQI